MYREGVPEYVGYRGNKYTDDLTCYEPMCRSCHMKHDMEKDPEAMERRREGNRRGDKRAAGQAFAARLKSDPEFAREMAVIQARAALLGGEATGEKYRTDAVFRAEKDRHLQMGRGKRWSPVTTQD
jgi:hypothetical protein